jgi:peptidoglycan hydrolase-like protein with peptidoglycan-binding domain
MRVKQKNTAKLFRQMILIGVVVCLGACSEQPVAPAKSIRIVHANDTLVRKVQVALRKEGYYTGVTDGFLGQNTAFAIQRFQVDHDQIARPYIDRALLASLGIATHYQGD